MDHGSLVNGIFRVGFPNFPSLNSKSCETMRSTKNTQIIYEI